MPSRAAPALLLSTVGCFGCTLFDIRGSNTPTIIARALEMGGQYLADTPIGFRLATHPRGELMVNRSVCWGKADMWRNAHAFVSIDRSIGLGFSLIPHEGMNEHGLTISPHSLRNSQFPPPPPPGSSVKKVCWMDLTGWGLGNFATAAEMVTALRTTHTVIDNDEWLVDSDKEHLSVADATGAHLVLEYTDGRLAVHNNTVGVLTNDPPFAWHLHNLNNYAALSPAWPKVTPGIGVTTEVGTVPQALSHGINLVGLPGDASPAGRFVRAFLLRQFAQQEKPPRDKAEAITLASQLLNSVTLIKGTAPHDPGLPITSGKNYGYTQFAALKIPALREFYYRTYDNPQWRMVDLSRARLDRAASTPINDGTTGIVDLTPNWPPA